ncbi:Hypothetical predicted protein [Cloeon dipterum]|uniref:Uncharacterized protein n=1 Tax=Cloeon dipterum TaxID=197152 RepID=A0A8S1C0Q9_9INSE|nr:Hypothetical predicted protein [Cloeon dipterum]
MHICLEVAYHVQISHFAKICWQRLERMGVNGKKQQKTATISKKSRTILNLDSHKNTWKQPGPSYGRREGEGPLKEAALCSNHSIRRTLRLKLHRLRESS